MIREKLSSKGLIPQTNRYKILTHLFKNTQITRAEVPRSLHNVACTRVYSVCLNGNAAQAV